MARYGPGWCTTTTARTWTGCWRLSRSWRVRRDASDRCGYRSRYASRYKSRYRSRFESRYRGHCSPGSRGARRGRHRLPAGHRPPLARARAGYLGDEEEGWDDLLPYVGAHAEHVVAAIEHGTTGPNVTPRSYC
ncbi:aminoglycoside adenylyltransferase domain-containing protein [Streptomyces scopuliridis]|uniref:aminoglycoside adenylyltransferase domain-containing protein n=1 Tax=Streptomyces scopuliridis TaxID=452529 RepID=UPI0036BA965F